tara:strand:- start:137 stop:241 length:105 start_codon:yes stop_codon:yes gene_type:complete
MDIEEASALAATGDADAIYRHQPSVQQRLHYHHE